MPIAVKDFTYEETENTVYLSVPLKGVKANKVDIFSSEEYLKVSFPPYLFECLLFAPVDDDRSTAKVGNGMVVFKLSKKEPALWNKLQSDLSIDKSVMKQKREEAITKSQEKAEEITKQKAIKKRDNEKYTIGKMMKIEEGERKRIEDVKEAERKQATDDLEKWKEEQRLQAEKEKQRILEERKQNDKNKKADIQRLKTDKTNMFEDKSDGIPMRESGIIDVKFTPRVFPTPIRESSTPLEEEHRVKEIGQVDTKKQLQRNRHNSNSTKWLKKQADARRIIDSQDGDLTEEERNPIWLRDKGNSFFKAGNYHAAINAFSHAIRLDSKLPALYSNRSACHLKLGNLMKCVEDSSKALELLQPAVSQNASSRCKAYVRRGTAFCQLELYVEGLREYEAAIKIDPNNEQLREDAEKIRSIIQSSAS